MSLRFGYIVPEFPGQTHIFFWREIKRLEEAGARVDLVSTRKPPINLQSHAWSTEAERRTIYLLEHRRPRDLLRLALAGLKTAPSGWGDCLRSISRHKPRLADRAKLLAMAVMGARLARLGVEREWDHMHVHSCANAANITAFASLMSKIPYSLTLHGPLSDYGDNQAEKWAHATFAVAITQKLFGEVEAELGPSVSAKTVIAPMGVDLDAFQRESAYEPWRGTGAARVISVGRLNPCKGHDDLIRAISLLREQGMDVRLEIAGEDEQGGSGYRLYLESLIEELGLSDHVKLAGAIGEAAVRKGLLNSHLFALASHNEPLGVAIMEAMALDLPVVVSAGGGVAELIDDQVDGLLVHSRDPAAIGDAIRSILVDPEKAHRLAAASRRKIEQKFTDDRSATILLELARTRLRSPAEMGDGR